MEVISSPALPMEGTSATDCRRAMKQVPQCVDKEGVNRSVVNIVSEDAAHTIT